MGLLFPETVICWVTFGLEFVVTVLRFIETSKQRFLSGTNIFILTALAASLAANIIGTWILHQILNSDKLLDLAYLEALDHIRELLKISFAIQYIFYIALYAIKGSFLCLYYPLFRSMALSSRVVFWVGTALSGAIRRIRSNIFTVCSPFFNRVFIISVAAMNISSDFVVMCLPLFMISRLLIIHRTAKIAIVLVITMAFISILASIMKSMVLLDLSHTQKDAQGTNSWSVAMWLTIEIWAAYTAACLPALRKRLVFSWRSPVLSTERLSAGSSWLRKVMGSRSRTGGGESVENFELIRQDLERAGK
ncbi:hypothetical protein EDC01DRAFT_748168 [Geopyxis carbonaria]|nr:hypothetical protein EDC01DRAFT_748168 [Geopyxis carbonaria]